MESIDKERRIRRISPAEGCCLTLLDLSVLASEMLLSFDSDPACFEGLHVLHTFSELSDLVQRRCRRVGGIPRLGAC